MKNKMPKLKQVCHHCGDTSGTCDCSLPCKCGNTRAKCTCDKKRDEKRLKEWALSRMEWL